MYSLIINQDKMDYKEQIKDPRWQKRRLEIFQKDEFTCKLCGNSQKTLHVHHIEYLSNHKIWEYDDKHLITLCEDCHSYVHELKALNIISKGVPYSDVLSFIETISELTAVSYKIKKERDIEKE